MARAWRRGPRQAFAAVSAELDGPAAGVVVTSMVPSITAVDRRGRPLLPGLLYGDARAARPGRRGRRRAGQRPGGERDQGRRMLGWAVGQQPGARGYWNCQAMATHALTGVPAVDMATAMSFGDLYTRGRWDTAALADAGWWTGPAAGGRPDGRGHRHACRARPPPSPVGRSTPSASRSWPAPTRPGDVLVIFGATLIVWVVTDQWNEAPGLISLPHTVPGLFLIGGPSNAGALFVDWAALRGRAPAAAGVRRPPATVRCR